MAGFIDNFREALRSLQPSVIAQRNVEKKTPSRAPQEVGGFEEDKANYGDIAPKDGDSLAWRNITARNDDDGTQTEFSIGYDADGKISGIRQKSGDVVRGYYGKDNIQKFFQSNFDRDATNYSLFDEGQDGSNTQWIIFNSKSDGAFIPSYALNANRKSQRLPKQGDTNDKPNLEDEFITNIRREQGARGNSMYVEPDQDKAQAADNGTMRVFENVYIPRTKEEMDFFTNNSGDFINMAMEFSRTVDPNTRKQILEKAYQRFGSLPRFASYLDSMMRDEQDYAQGYYPSYDYTRVGPMIGDAINGMYNYLFHYT